MLVVKGVSLVRFVCIVSIISVIIVTVLVETLSSMIPGPGGVMIIFIVLEILPL